jgi:hypothetical protein
MTMQMTITTNLDDVRRRLSGLEKQVNFAASKALRASGAHTRCRASLWQRRAAQMPGGGACGAPWHGV